MLFPKTETPKTPLSDIDIDKITKALKAASVNTSETKTGAENFYEDIVFDSEDKINKNFITLMNIYIPSLDINAINTLLRENGINDDMQKIINDNDLKCINYLLRDSIMRIIFMKIYSGTNKTDIILVSLLYILITKLFLTGTSVSFYYLNDYDTVKDFIIYIIPNNYSGDKTKLNKDSSISFINNFNSMIDNNKVYKISLKTIIRENIMRDIIIRALNNISTETTMAGITNPTRTIKDKNNVTETDYNNFELALNENSSQLNKYLNYAFAGNLLVANKKGDITTDIKLFNEYATFMSNKVFFTDSFNVYSGLESVWGKQNELLNDIVNESKRQYNNRNKDNNRPNNGPNFLEPLEIWIGENYTGIRFTVDLASINSYPKTYTKEDLNLESLKSLKVPDYTIYPNNGIDGYRYQVSITYKNNDTPEIQNNNSIRSITQTDSSGNEIESITINKLSVVRSINTTTTRM
jgi:hypothetical protein